MITVDEALERVAEHASALPPSSCDTADACGLVLAESIVSDSDSPPFDKSMVDGFAIHLDDDSERLRIAEVVTAGCVAAQAVVRGVTIHVMTGAPTPPGTDAVVKWEDCERLDDQTIRNPRAQVSAGYCVLTQGTSYRAGDVLMESGKRLGPLDLGLLAELGKPEIRAFPRPTVGVLATGDELVGSGDPLVAGRIRNSNGPMLLAAAASADCTAVDLGASRDDAEDLKNRIARGLGNDVLLVCGGVSAGIKDFVPGVLSELGVSRVFHKVEMKPGKPLWFGYRESSDRRTLVFGLPGNPVSAYVAFYLFAAPALVALSGGRF
ncbi:MAG: molybdopterin molybdotransferase MoeA, partial [Planctomycetota bacterium]